mgnify:CR=1 FL=1
MGELQVIVTDDRYGSYEIEKNILKEIGAEITVYKMLGQDEAAEVLRNADAVLMNCFQMTAETIEAMEKCRIISRFGVGVDNVAIDAATSKGIWVANVPDYAMEDVSDHALALLLSCIRRITFRDSGIRSGQWDMRDKRPAYRIRGSVLGIVGCGRIGGAFLRKASSLGFSKILIYDPLLEDVALHNMGGTPVSFDELIESADFISVHAPLNEETKYLFNRTVFKRMKKNAIIVNTARGPLINEVDIAAALEQGDIAYAGLDVFEQEPLPQESPLLQLDNVILSDHAGWYSEESVEELKSKAAKNILETFKTGKPVYPVNQV